MFNLIRGLGIPPVIVGIVRGIVEAGVLAAIMAVSQEVSSLHFSTGAETTIPVVLWGLRSFEGLVDHIDPSKSRITTTMAGK